MTSRCGATKQPGPQTNARPILEIAWYSALYLLARPLFLAAAPVLCGVEIERGWIELLDVFHGKLLFFKGHGSVAVF